MRYLIAENSHVYSHIRCVNTGFWIILKIWDIVISDYVPEVGV